MILLLKDVLLHINKYEQLFTVECFDGVSGDTIFLSSDYDELLDNYAFNPVEDIRAEDGVLEILIID